MVLVSLPKQHVQSTYVVNVILLEVGNPNAGAFTWSDLTFGGGAEPIAEKQTKQCKKSLIPRFHPLSGIVRTVAFVQYLQGPQWGLLGFLLSLV